MAVTSARLRQSQQLSRDGLIRFGIYAGLGIAIGAFVALVEWLTLEVAVEEVLHAPLWLQMVLPGVGLVVVALIYRVVDGLSRATSDAYVESFHTGDGPHLKDLVPKVLASMATIGSGGAQGLEGPAVLSGSTMGAWLGARAPKALGERSQRILLVAGAAAGVAAVFKTPATGVLFALEVPYRRDLTRHALIPALVASAASYVTFVLLIDAEPLLRFAPAEVTLTDELVGAVVLGFIGGATARLLATTFRWAKHQVNRFDISFLILVAAVVMAGCTWAADAMLDLPATIGPGTGIIAEIVTDTEVGLAVLLGLFFLRAITTCASFSAGGVGGAFIPLVVQGLLLGRLAEIVFDVPSTGLYPVIGLAAVLGASYRTPLAAVVFVAESTGRAEFVIPALIATALAQSLMGEVSVSDSQLSERQGHLERRLGAAAITVAITDAGTLTPDTGLLEVIDRYGDHPVAPAIPVADTEYRGLLVLHDMATAIMDLGLEATCGEAMRHVKPVLATDSAVKAARLMNEADTAAVAVVDDQNQPVGVISALSLAGLRDIE